MIIIIISYNKIKIKIKIKIKMSDGINIDEFRENVKDIIESNLYENQIPIIPNDHTFKRFLLAYNNDVQKSVKNYRKTIEWREINDIGDISSEEEWDTIETNKSYLNHIKDKYGIPLEIFIYNEENVHHIKDKDNFVQKLIIENEMYYSKYKKMNEMGMIIIYDFRKLYYNQVVKYIQYIDSIKYALYILDTYYPGRGREIYIIGVSYLFSKIFNMVKEYIPNKTLNIINMYNSSKEELNTFIDDIATKVEDSQLFVETLNL
jgi:hypothetical protein